MRRLCDRDRLVRGLPFALVAAAGQLSATWPGGPTNAEFFSVSCALLVLAVAAGLASRQWVVGRRLPAALIYLSSVAFLMLGSGGINSGVGSLLLIPVVAIALYGRRLESAVVVGAVIVLLLSLPLTGPHVSAVLARRALLFGWIAAMLSVAIQTLRQRLVEANVRTMGLLRQAEAINDAARELTCLLDPPAITALGVQLAAQIAWPADSEFRRATYFRVEEGFVVIDAQFDDSGHTIEGQWPLAEHPPLKQAVDTRQAVRAELAAEDMGPGLRAVLNATGVTHGAWVPVCPDGMLHGVLAVASRGLPLPDECVEQCVALGHLLELALSNWSAHRRLEQQATTEERRRIARELHDGLAHELAFIASRSRRSTRSIDPEEAQELAKAADRALDEARRAITVLSVSRPQSLPHAVAQTAEDLGARLGVAVELDLAEDVDTPGDVTENMLRIVREAMTNAANHGKPDRVSVRLENADGVRLVVEDDGCGFDPQGPRRPGGFGLLSMEERAVSMGATLRVDSALRRGTRVEVAFA